MPLGSAEKRIMIWVKGPKDPHPSGLTTQSIGDTNDELGGLPNDRKGLKVNTSRGLLNSAEGD